MERTIVRRERSGKSRRGARRRRTPLPSRGGGTRRRGGRGSSGRCAGGSRGPRRSPGRGCRGGGRRIDLRAGERGLDPREDPRRAERAAADHHAGGAGGAQEREGVGRGEDAAVGEDGDPDGGDRLRDASGVDGPGVHLARVAPVDGEEGGAGVGADARELRGGGMVRVGADARLHGDGEGRGGADHRLDAAAEEGGGAHQRGAVAVRDDAAHRTAGVEVDRGEAAEPRDDARGLGELGGVVAVELRGERAVSLLGDALEEGRGVARAADEPRGGDHLRRGGVRAGVERDGAERGVGHLGQRRERDARRTVRRDGALHEREF